MLVEQNVRALHEGEQNLLQDEFDKLREVHLPDAVEALEVSAIASRLNGTIEITDTFSLSSFAWISITVRKGMAL